MYAPIAIFAFNRPGNLRQVLAALAANTIASMSDVTIFCDGPRSESEAQKTEAVRAVAHAAMGFASVEIVERDVNWGLRRSLVAGITSLVEKYGRVIVVEDDIVTSKFFLQYMNDALDCYEGDTQVASISGFCVDHCVRNPPETFFMRGGDCWGWATWRDRWRFYNPNGQELLSALKKNKLEREFDLGGACNATQVLQDAVDGKVDSWFMLWTASLFLREMYTLYPSRSLVENIGFNSGTHSNNARYSQQVPTDSPVLVKKQPVTEDKMMMAGVRRWYKKNMGKSRTKEFAAVLRAVAESIKTVGVGKTIKKIFKFFNLFS